MTWRDMAGSMGRRALHSRRVRKAVVIGGASVLVTGAGVALAGVGIGLAGWAWWRRLSMAGEDVQGRVVLITGSSRGLGFALAQEFARLGARLVICARDAAQLETARAELAQSGAEVLAVSCDVSARDQVEQMVRQANERFGRIDILINNAGIITVGPLESQTVEDFHEAMNVMYWGVVYPTLAVLPQMLERRRGHIANITSIGGKVAVPHLLPYSAAKFAAVGFSEGLRAEVLKDGVKVTTVVPGLMRTGSHWNAHFKGDHRAEFTWFSLAATMPLISTDGRRAARKVVEAVRQGRSEIILGPHARLLAAVHGLFPGLTGDLMSLVNRALPRGTAKDRRTGKESETAVSRSFLEVLGRRAAVRFNQPAASGAPRPVIVPR
jgi:short-subunit dehydrogenase